jgi:two-component system phosphate regulon response regulator PhoB
MEGAASNNTGAEISPWESAPGSLEGHRVLIVEQDWEAAGALHTALLQAGFQVHVLDKGQDPQAAVDAHRPHLVMLDWDMPAVIAMDLLQHIRRTSVWKGTRLIALSNFSGEQHVVSGFELGVDDYVVKPFSVSEVVARARAVLRPLRNLKEQTNYLEFGEMQIHLGEVRLTIRDKTIPLRNMEFQLLQFLMQRPERACSREMLLYQVWGRDSRSGLRAVDVTVQRIRRALMPHGCGDHVQTIRGLGYRLSVEPG